MKKILLLILLFSIFYSCKGAHCEGESCKIPECDFYDNINECSNGQVCNENRKCVHPCEIERYCGDGACVKDPELNGKAQYHCECAENMKKKIKCCQEEEYCSYDVSVHYIKADIVSDYSCYISIGCFELPSYCYESSDCSGYAEYVNNEIMEFGVCNHDYKCQLRCENDDDCVGILEYCHKTEKTCYHHGNLNPCYKDNPDYTYSCESNNCYFLGATQDCTDYCQSDDECPEPVTKCSNKDGLKNGYCVLPCSTNNECQNYKWSGGRYCDVKQGYCTDLILCSDNEDCVNNEYAKTCNIEKGFCVQF